MISKKPTPKYILDARRGGLTYDEAIEKILEENGVEVTTDPKEDYDVIRFR